MNIRRLKRLRGKLNNLRRKGGIKSSEVETLAKAVGRVRHHTRGKEPTWISKEFKELRPLSIPHHSADLNRFTAASILDQLEGDIEKYEETLETEREANQDEEY